MYVKCVRLNTTLLTTKALPSIDMTEQESDTAGPIKETYDAGEIFGSTLSPICREVIGQLLDLYLYSMKLK